jgi:hypothetical protein
MATLTHHNPNDNTLYIINKVVISPCNKERRELLRMVVMGVRMPKPSPIIEESELDIFAENPNPCPF